jgi:ubiquinone/menaquinone biosynthesis C-methylase UbiE
MTIPTAAKRVLRPVRRALLGPGRRVVGAIRRRLLGRARVKRRSELGYWRGRQAVEGTLGHSHYEFFYTEHFGLDRRFYSGKAVLDVGCGPRGSLEWADMAATRIGLDPLVESYRELGIERHAMTYVGAPAEEMPFADDSFDVVVSFNSLDHVDDLHRAVQEIKRVVRPGGLFLLLTEVGHPPADAEPQSFSWTIVESFAPELDPVEVRSFERSGAGIYDSIVADVSYDHTLRTRRTGILSAKFRKPASSPPQSERAT